MGALTMFAVRTALSVVLLSASLAAAQTIPAATSQATPAASSHTCPVVNTPSTAGELQIAADKTAEAETTFRAALAADPTSDEAGLGLVRALLGQDRLVDAEAEAGHLLQQHPGNAVAEVAASETAFRTGDLDGALAHAHAATRDNACEARAYAAYAAVLDLNGYYGTEARYMTQAHRLRPDDELIRRSWLQLLPRKERQEELRRYLDGPHTLSDDDARGYQNELAHLKARRHGECRITSKTDTTRIGLQPVYGDHSHPVAFGLDVTLNNTRRRMQIDTGASGIVLTQSAARALKLEPEYNIRSGGIGDEGKRDSYLAHVRSIRIGDVEVSDCMVEVIAKTQLDVDGLIGMDVFNRWLVTLDYADAQLQLDPLPRRPGSAKPATPDPGTSSSDAKSETTDSQPAFDDTGDDGQPRDRYIAPEMKDWGRVLRIGHQILLPAFYMKAPHGTPHYLIMDTGADVTNLSSAMAKQAGKLHGSATEFRGISGKVNKVYETDPTSLVVANLVLPTASYYAYDMTQLSHSTGFEISGLLGLPTLQRLTIKIDYRDNLIKLSYDPKHDITRFSPGQN